VKIQQTHLKLEVLNELLVDDSWQLTLSEHSVNIQGTFREHFSEHSVKIQ
jgi:hypothetical protein